MSTTHTTPRFLRKPASDVSPHASTSNTLHTSDISHATLRSPHLVRPQPQRQAHSDYLIIRARRHQLSSMNEVPKFLDPDPTARTTPEKQRPKLDETLQRSSSHSVTSSLRAFAAKLRLEEHDEEQDAPTTEAKIPVSSPPATSTSSPGTSKFRRPSWLHTHSSGDRVEHVQPIKPLRPPIRRSVIPYEEDARSRVVIETPFNEHDVDPFDHISGLQNKQPNEDTTVRNERAGIRGIVNKLGCASGRLNKQNPSVKTASLVTADPQMPGHSTLLKKKNTEEELNQVSSVLKLQKLVWPRARTKSVPVSPVETRKISDALLRRRDRTDTFGNTYIPSVLRGILGPETFYRKRLALPASPALSYTSSQRDLRMGPVPRNTPQEDAMYRIKRSRSAETEVFLKVDISIRGGTSYLPSEARRIHTPPLPEVKGDGRLRGFFFDYNAPSSKHSREGSFTTATYGSQQSKDEKDKQVVKSTKIESAESSAPSGPSNVLGSGCPTKDWYDIHLEQLDRDSPSLQCNTSTTLPFFPKCNSAWQHQYRHHSHHHKHRDGNSSAHSTVWKFDESIPEHLPSSWLCPRHPKYWRITEGVGSEFRGCWMHGVGEYKVGEVIFTNY